MPIPWTSDPAANRLLEEDPLALLIGLVLDQQVPMEKAFMGPKVLKERLGGKLDVKAIAAMDPDRLNALFRERPALHRFPGSMAKRVQALCQALVERYGGDAAGVWRDVKTGRDLSRRIAELPGFGEEKTKITVAVLGKKLGVRPPGWEAEAASWKTIADVDSEESMQEVRDVKRARKREARG